MDHVWLLMRSHAQAETRLHSGELGAVQVRGDNANDGARLGIRGAPRKRAWGGPARPQGPAPLSLASPPSPPLPKWRIACSSSWPSPSGSSG